MVLFTFFVSEDLAFFRSRQVFFYQLVSEVDFVDSEVDLFDVNINPFFILLVKKIQLASSSI